MAEAEQTVRHLLEKTLRLQDAAVEIRWERVVAPGTTTTLLKTGRAFNPRTNEDLQALYRGYKKLYQSALIHMNQLKQHKEDILGSLRTRTWTPSQIQRLRVIYLRVKADIKDSEEGLAYLRGRMEKWKAYVDRAGHGPVDVQGALPENLTKLPHLEQFLSSGAHSLTKKRLEEMIQKAEMIRDVANYEARQLGGLRREKEANRRGNERYWRQAQGRGLDTKGYARSDRVLAAEIRDLREQIQKQRQKAARAERLIRDLTNRLRRGQFASAPFPAGDSDDDDEYDYENLEPAGVSLVPKRLKRLRKKKQARSHEKQAKREARKARKARQDEIRLQEKPLEQEEKKLSRELKQAKKREREIKRKEKQLIKRRRNIRKKRKRLKKDRRRARKKKVVAQSLGEAINTLPVRVVSNMVQASDELQHEPLELHHEDAVDDALEDATHALLALAHAAVGTDNNNNPIGDHWTSHGDDDDEYLAYDRVPPTWRQSFVDWVESWGEVFRPSSSSVATLGTPVSRELAHQTFHYAGECVSDALAEHPMAAQSELMRAWSEVHDAFNHLLRKVGDRHALHRAPQQRMDLPLAVSERMRNMARDNHLARVRCMDALTAWAESLAETHDV